MIEDRLIYSTSKQNYIERLSYIGWQIKATRKKNNNHLTIWFSVSDLMYYI